MKSRGFTIIELVIVITILGILMVLGTVSLGSSQISGRDSKRKADIEAIANSLETYYNSGTDTHASTNQYPSIAELISGGNSSMTSTLRDISLSSLTAPGATDPASTLLAATNSAQTISDVTPLPTIAQYIYQPLTQQSDGSWVLCSAASQECRKFNLYYRLESDNSINKVTSKNQ
jgi:prepilin-type N-terminal cleavage/methylation domain-containing protein